MNIQAYDFFMYMIWSNDSKKTENTPTLNLLSGITRYITSLALMKVQMTIFLGQILFFFSYKHPSMIAVVQTVGDTKQAWRFSSVKE